MPRLAFANSFWESYDVLEKPVKAGVRKAMEKFQRLTVAELHADKGLHLEFRCVAVLGATASALPFAREVTPASVDPLQHESDLLRERCLLFVACTRAREALHVSWAGTPSEFVPRPAGR